VGTVFDIELRLERDPQTHDLVERPHGTHMVYVAVLGNIDAFRPRMWALAWHCGVPTAADSSVTANGAERLAPSISTGTHHSSMSPASARFARVRKAC
jgi:hypothetical protein